MVFTELSCSDWFHFQGKDSIGNYSRIEDPPCPWKCELTNEAGYVVYSALGSFYIPMFVMLFFYWRIYRAAVRTTRAINQGFKTTKGQYCFILTTTTLN